MQATTGTAPDFQDAELLAEDSLDHAATNFEDEAFYFLNSITPGEHDSPLALQRTLSCVWHPYTL